MYYLYVFKNTPQARTPITIAILTAALWSSDHPSVPTITKSAPKKGVTNTRIKAAMATFIKNLPNSLQVGSTLINHTLYAAAERAAAQAKFTPAADGAPPHQSGNIIYVFKMGER